MSLYVLLAIFCLVCAVGFFILLAAYGHLKKEVTNIILAVETHTGILATLIENYNMLDKDFNDFLESMRIAEEMFRSGLSTEEILDMQTLPDDDDDKDKLN